MCRPRGDDRQVRLRSPLDDCGASPSPRSSRLRHSETVRALGARGKLAISFLRLRAMARFESGAITCAQIHRSSRRPRLSFWISPARSALRASGGAASRAPPPHGRAGGCGRSRTRHRARPGTGLPTSTAWRAAASPSGQRERFASVRLFTLPPSRKLSRKSAAGGGPWFGTRTTPVTTHYDT